jgi:hypothetical protein
LSKWYIDCVGDGGECAIAYHVRLSWGPIALGYASLLRRGARDGTCSESTLRAGPEPVTAPGYVAWDTPALGLQVTAQSHSVPFSRHLLRGPQGNVSWECVAPGAEVRVRCGPDFALNGLGYAERLEVSSTSWRLPIEQLRWGRFLTPTRALVWIGWWGPEPRTLVFDDGRCQADAVIEDGAIRFGRSHLALDRGAIIRDADLAETIEPLARLLGPAVGGAARIHETKWLSRGTLHDPAVAAPAEGWAIHELVVFP